MRSSPTCTTCRIAYATTDNVHGFFVTPLGNFDLGNVYLSS